MIAAKAFVFAMILSLPIMAVADVSLSNAWVREAAVDGRVMSAYMIIHNKIETPIVIDKLTSPQFEQTELHEMYLHEGRMQMRAVNTLEIIQTDTAELLTGGMHVMLINPLVALKVGDKVTLRFHLSNGSVESFELPIKKSLPIDYSGLYGAAVK